MIVYRDATRFVDPRLLLAAIEGRLRAFAGADRISHAEATDLLVLAGELEAGLMDAQFPDADGLGVLAGPVQGTTLAFARLFRLSARRREPGLLRRAAADARAAIARQLQEPLPRKVRLKVSEGYAYYGLYPETYLEAAERFGRDTAPAHAVVIGLRSIGTSLSAVVAAGLEDRGWSAETLSLRPRGPCWDRRPRLTRALHGALRCRHDRWFLIVDEGPGLSGSSFCGTAELLAGLGIADGHIVFFPSRETTGEAFRSEAARQRWPRHRKTFVSFEQAWLRHRRIGDGTVDLSGGRWRDLLCGSDAIRPAVQPQHERRKYLEVEARGGALLFRFAGLGRYGETGFRRAAELAESGFGPPAVGFKDGFLALRFVRGRPLTPPAGSDPEFLRAAAAYVAYRARSFPTGGTVGNDEVTAMIEANVGELLGPGWLDGLRGLGRFMPVLDIAPEIEVDGRMLPHEWLQTRNGYLKTDGTDHNCDHFFPGAHDIAWDVAALEAEFLLPDGAGHALAQAVADATRDRTLPDRLPFQSVAYLAFRLGYATLAARTLERTPDGWRMARLARRYKGQLRRAVLRLSAGLRPRSLIR